MQEMKPPKKPFVFYYVIALVVLLLVNFLLIPQLRKFRKSITVPS